MNLRHFCVIFYVLRCHSFVEFTLLYAKFSYMSYYSMLTNRSNVKKQIHIIFPLVGGFKAKENENMKRNTRIVNMVYVWFCYCHSVTVSSRTKYGPKYFFDQNIYEILCRFILSNYTFQQIKKFMSHLTFYAFQLFYSVWEVCMRFENL